MTIIKKSPHWESNPGRTQRSQTLYELKRSEWKRKFVFYKKTVACRHLTFCRTARTRDDPEVFNRPGSLISMYMQYSQIPSGIVTSHLDIGFREHPRRSFVTQSWIVNKIAGHCTGSAMRYQRSPSAPNGLPSIPTWSNTFLVMEFDHSSCRGP